MSGPNPLGICLCGCGQPTRRAPYNSGLDVKGEFRRFANAPSCSSRARTGFKTVADRFWSKVDRTGGPDACWPWMGSLKQGNYGQFAPATGKGAAAHRFAYELSVGPIPEGLSLDHLCHTNDETCAGGESCPHRRCVNPAHLEPVTPKVNVLRARTAPSAINAQKTHCIRGHELTGENLRIDKHRDGWARVCLTCRRQSDLRGYHARSAAKKSA